MRLDEWQKFIESQFVEANETSAEIAAPEVDGASTLVTNVPSPGVGLAERSMEQTTLPIETAPAQQPTQQFVASSMREPASNPVSEPPSPQSTDKELPAPRLGSAAQSQQTEPDAGSHRNNQHVRIYAEPDSLPPREEPEQSSDRTPRRRMSQSIAAHPVFAAETMGRTSAAGSQPILSTPSFPAAAEPAISSANRKAERASSIYPTPDSAADSSHQTESREKNHLLQTPADEPKQGGTLSEFYVEIPAFAAYLPGSHAAHALASQKTADPVAAKKEAPALAAGQPAALQTAALPVIRESILTPQIDIAVKTEPKAERVSAVPAGIDPPKPHPQASIPRTVTVVSVGKSGNAGVVSSVSMSPSSKRDSAPPPAADRSAQAQNGVPAAPHEAQKTAPAEPRRRLFGVSVPAYSPPSSTGTSVKQMENQERLDDEAVEEQRRVTAEQRSNPVSAELAPAEIPTGQTVAGTVEDFAVREPADTGSSKSKPRYARNVIPNVRNTSVANAEGGLSAAELWATVPRHVQSLLALDRQDQQKETAQSSYKRPFQEKRHELIERLLDPILSLEDAARLLNVCPTTVRRYTNRGILTYYRKETERGTVASPTLDKETDKETRQRRFRLSDILAFLEAQESALAADRLAEQRTSGSDSASCDTGHE